MQKGRLLLFIFFPLITVFIVLLVLKLFSQHSLDQKVLAAHTKNGSIQSFVPITKPSKASEISQTPTLTQIPTPIPTKKVVTKQVATISQQLKTPTSPTEHILTKVNEYRLSLGLSKVSSNSETCNFAKTRAEEISSKEKFNHDGFQQRVNQNNLPYPSYSQITENIAYNTDYTDVVNRWIASPGHAENMRKDTPFVCIGKFGDYYAYEGWKP